MVNSRKKPSFRRWMSYSYSRVSESWRRPRGKTNKIIRHEKGKFKMPCIGWGSNSATRNLHPSGFYEIVVCCVNDLNNIDKKTHAVKISATVGRKKRTEILKKANEMKIKILNKTDRFN